MCHPLAFYRNARYFSFSTISYLSALPWVWIFPGQEVGVLVRAGGVSDNGQGRKGHRDEGNHLLLSERASVSLSSPESDWLTELAHWDDTENLLYLVFLFFLDRRRRRKTSQKRFVRARHDINGKDAVEIELFAFKEELPWYMLAILSQNTGILYAGRQLFFRNRDRSKNCLCAIYH